MKVEVARVHGVNYGVYGPRKVWLQLNGDGIEVARCTVERPMNVLGLHGDSPRQAVEDHDAVVATPRSRSPNVSPRPGPTVDRHRRSAYDNALTETVIGLFKTS